METNCNAHPDDVKIIGVRITRGQADRLRIVAESRHRTVSQELRRLIDQCLAEAATLDEKEAA